jgi:hypothetical protein
MRYFLSVVLPFFLITELFAQGFTSGKGFASVDLKLSSVQGRTAYIFGVRGGWPVSQSFSIGLAGCGAVITNPVTNIINNQEYYIRLVYGGLYLEYQLYSFNFGHIRLSTIVGGGYYGHSAVKSDYEIDWTKHRYFVIEPEVIAMFDISDSFKTGIGISYRYIPNVDLKEFENRKLNAPAVLLTFRFVIN